MFLYKPCYLCFFCNMLPLRGSEGFALCTWKMEEEEKERYRGGGGEKKGWRKGVGGSGTQIMLENLEPVTFDLGAVACLTDFPSLALR